MRPRPEAKSRLFLVMPMLFTCKQRILQRKFAQGSAKIMAHRDACLYLALGYFFGAGGCSGGALVIRPTANGTVGLFGSGFAWTLKL